MKIIKSYAKINLTLKVLKKLKNGMHDIESHACLIDLHDQIEIKKNKKDRVIFTGKFKKETNQHKNSILDTLKILRENNIINYFYKIVVRKNIPVFSGLGGGTANSVSLTKYFIKNNPNEFLVRKLEKKIGSDFRLFLNSFSFQKNLKKIQGRKKFFTLHFLIVYPMINCRTKHIYSLVKKFSFSKKKHYFTSKKIEFFFKEIKSDKNDLQQIVEKKHFQVGELINYLKNQKDCVFSRMTGSGSVSYGLFKSKKMANIAKKKIKKKYPNYWCATTKTI
tara:strand:+ start:63 stop:896 length:834 start_codon:yes stop_codon:yes gene_type:complete